MNSNWFFFFQAEDGIRDYKVTGVQTCALPICRAQVQERSFYELLPVAFGGATQTIGADAASAEDAELLQVPVGSPVLVCERITADASGSPVLIGEYVFPAHRTEFTV